LFSSLGVSILSFCSWIQLLLGGKVSG
jgi:hypothetical protein